MAKIVNTRDVQRIDSIHDARFRYNVVEKEHLGLSNIKGDVVFYPPGAAGANHHHIGTENLFYIIQGKATMYIDDKPHEVKAGDFVSIFDGERHWFKNTSEEMFSFVELFTPAKFQTVWDNPDLK